MCRGTVVPGQDSCLLKPCVDRLQHRGKQRQKVEVVNASCIFIGHLQLQRLPYFKGGPTGTQSALWAPSLECLIDFQCGLTPRWANFKLMCFPLPIPRCHVSIPVSLYLQHTSGQRESGSGFSGFSHFPPWTGFQRAKDCFRGVVSYGLCTELYQMLPAVKDEM